MTRLRLRFAFDAGAGVCLWAADDATRERFGYAVETAELPVEAELRERVERLIAWHDESVDWDDPGGASPWDEGERERFEAEAHAVLAILRDALAPEFEIEADPGTAP